MKAVESSRQQNSGIGIDGAILALAPLPFLFLIAGGVIPEPISWRFILAWLSAITAFFSGILLDRHPVAGKIFGTISLVASFTLLSQWLVINPFAALSATVVLMSATLTLMDYTTSPCIEEQVNRYFQRARQAALMIPFIVVFAMVIGISHLRLAIYSITCSFLIAQIFFVYWLLKERSTRHLLVAMAGLVAVGLAIASSNLDKIPIIALVFSISNILSLLVLPRAVLFIESSEHWWEVLLDHPARILLFTFLILCVLGTILLKFPIATETGHIDLVDAAFTSVSAVCVTGLIVVDTPHVFTMFGQFVILLLIQLGGLGIMSITTVALQAIGRRLSLKRERLLTSMMADTDHKNLFQSLATILKFTLIAEAAGAVLLTLFFVSKGDPAGQAFWRGLFTAVSAFCNAGFALQSDSLMSYRNDPLILYVIASLIILGGMAPATSLLIPRWLSRKQIPIPALLALSTTAVLLCLGTFFVLAFEWEGVLAGLSLGDKIHNAWFQSVTLRTAGFNSVDIANITSPTFLVMLGFMFIGGSPGGTAGGIKTLTIWILTMTFWTNITNRNEIIVSNRRVCSSTVYQAITILIAGLIVWFVIVLMLEATQQIPVRDLIFEATSALGTVGLSTGATSMLDEIGKIIVIIAMFIGRIGPVTLFMLVSDDHVTSGSRYPDTKIPLT